jgi:ribosome biogenesis GTPase
MPAARTQRRIDGVALRCFENFFDLRRCPSHFRSTVSRDRGAILRVDDVRPALVVSTGKNSAWISVDGETLARIAQLRRMPGKRFMPVPGDVVSARVFEDGTAMIERIEPRSMTLERRAAGGRSKTMAANVNMLVTVTALADPPPRLVILDQLLAFAELQQVRAVVVFTKPDLVDASERDRLPSLYRSLGYPTIVVNPKRDENVEVVRELIRTHRAMLAGNSGVGKSSIFRALGGLGSIGEVSRFGLGRQTTTAARLYRIGDGFLIDSPGVNEFGLGAIDASELTQGFPEMREPAQRCRFADCSHRQEPGCAVLAALAAEEIPATRYASYTKILAG